MKELKQCRIFENLEGFLMKKLMAVLLSIMLISSFFTAYAVSAAPAITGADMDTYMDANSIRLLVHFSEGIYGDSTQTAPIAKDDFTLTVSQNDGTVNGAVINTVNTTGNTAPTGGETDLLFYLTLTGGPPSGVETIAVSPADGESVYSISGTAMETSSAASAALWDKRVEFADTYPKAGNTQAAGSRQAQFMIVPLNETVTAYYVILADGAAAPDEAEIMAGTDSEGAAPAVADNTVVTIGGSAINVQLPADATDYDAYVVIKDSANNKTAPVKVDLRTPDAAPALPAPTLSTIAAGLNFSLCLKDDGTVWAWGNNDFGQLGRRHQHRENNSGSGFGLI